ncbi:MAG: hypothetical protein ABUM51_06635, partial [Bacteroidota bacterium]
MSRKVFLFVIRCLLAAVCSLPLAAHDQPAGPPAPIPKPAGQPPAPKYWQQTADFDIRVALDDNTHSLKGFETIRYTNHSPDTLTWLYIHCWPNAYKDQTTALYQQLSQIEERRGKLKKIKENGYIGQLEFRVNGTSALTEPHPKYAD